MKTYEIKYEPVKLQDGTLKDKYNIYYYDENGDVENKEYHSVDGVSGIIREGYNLKINK